MGTQPQKSSRKPPVSPDPNALYNSSNQESSLELQAQQQAQISIDQTQFPGLQIEGVLGGLPVAEKNQEYFAVVFEAADTTPEIIDQTQFKVIYLCDSQLNVSKPSQDSIALNNIIQNFERQKRARVRVDQGTVLNNQLAGLHQITAVGSIEPICGTQIGSGPLSYVTTMSFTQEGQLGPDLSRPIAGYYQWLNKTTGYQNTKVSYKTSGTTNQGDSWNFGDDVEEGKLQTYYDAVQADPSGAAVEAADSQSLYDDNYFDTIDIITGSIEGNSRVKVKVGAMVNIVTSSIADLTAGVLQRLQGFIDGGSAIDFDSISNALVTLNVYKEPSSGYSNRELLGSTTVAIPTINQSLAFYSNGSIAGVSAGSEVLTVAAFAILNNGPDGGFNVEDDIGGFSWGVNGSARPLVVETDYFEVNEDDKVYGELVFPEEEESPTIGALGLSMDDVKFAGMELGDGDLIVGPSSFTESLLRWRDTAALRQYSYFAGSSIMTQETPEAGAGFANNITGITASYYNYTDGEPTASVYNYTGSYWLNFNNFSSSADGIGAWITSSTALANFYGGDYIQVNPGTEDYNILNADSSPTSSLFINGLGSDDKLTWTNFGFNPIKRPFVPRAGDFIRFEFSKQKVFLITAVNSSGNVLKLKLDGHMETSTILDNFVIYRVVEDGQYIILDVKKNNEAGITQPFSGIISAEFPSENLDKRTDQLLFDLKQAGIVSERDYLK